MCLNGETKEPLCEEAVRGKSPCKLSFLFAMLLLVTAPAWSDVRIQETNSCAAYKMFSPATRKAVLKALIQRVEPKDPLIDNGVVDVIVTVHVFVDVNGGVVCALTTGKAHPLLERISVDAAKQCRFAPLKKHGIGIPFQGDLLFHIHR